MANSPLVTSDLRYFAGESFLSLEVVHTADDTSLMAGTKNGVVRILSLGNSTTTTDTLQLDAGMEKCVKVRAICHRDNILVCAGSNKTLLLYNALTRQPLFEFPDSMLSTSPFNCKLYGKYWLFANIGWELHLFDVSNPQAVSRRAVFRTHTSKVTGMAITKGANPIVVTTSWDHKVFLHVLKTMTSYQVNCGSAAVTHPAITSDLEQGATNQVPPLTDGRFPIPMRLADITDKGDSFAVGGYGKEVWLFSRDVENPPKYKQVYSISVQNTRLQIFSLVDGRERHNLSHYYTSPVRCIQTLPNDIRIITAGDDGRIRIHDSTTENDRFTLAVSSTSLNGLPDAILQNIQSFLIREQRGNEQPVGMHDRLEAADHGIFDVAVLDGFDVAEHDLFEHLL